MSTALQRLDFMVSLIDKVSGPAGKMMKNMDTVTTNVQSGFNKIGYGAAGLVGVGFAFNRLISKAVEFESVMADVNKTVNFATPDGLTNLSNDILEMTKTLPLTAQGLGEIAAAGGRLGLGEYQLPDFIDVTAKMATAFDLQTDSAGDYAANLSNIYKIPVDKLSVLGDVINHLSDNTASKAGDIINVLSRVGGTSEQIGLATNEVAAMSAQMLSLGIPAEQSATSMNAMFMRMNLLGEAGPKVQAVLSGMGLSAKSFANELKSDPQAAINGFLAKINLLDKQKQSIALSTIFGLEHAPKIALLAGSTEAYAKTLGLVADQQQYLGSMQKEFEVRSKTTKNQLVLLGNGWDRLMIGFGSLLLPTVINMIGKMNEVMNPISTTMARWGKLFPNLASGFGTIVASIFGLIATISVLSIIVGFSKFTIAGWKLAWMALKLVFIATKFSLMTMIHAVWAFTSALLANPITWIVLGITALIAVVIAAIVYWDQWTGSVINFASGFLEMLGVFGFVDSLLAAWEKLPEWWAGFKNWLGSLDVFAILGGGIDWIKNQLTDLLPDWAVSLLPSSASAPKPIAAPASMQPNNQRRGGPNGGVLNQISNASANNSRQFGDIIIQNQGQAMNGQSFMDELAFSAG